MRRIGFVILTFAVLLSFSCSTKVNPKVIYKGTYGSYVNVLDQWTRSKKVYEPSFDTVMVVTATYESKKYREVFLAEKIRAEAIPPQEAARLREQSDEELSRNAVFFVSFYTPKYKWNRLNVDDPSWRLWLIDGQGKKVAPLNVRKVSKIQYADTQYYPYYDLWSYFYRVTFPRKTDDGQELDLDKGMVTFQVAGVKGNASLVWDIP